MKFAYADPPYLGHAQKNYGAKAKPYDELETHQALIRHLVRNYPDGWALSMNPENLLELATEIPRGALICAWTKTNPEPMHTAVLRSWEPLILWRNHRRAQAARPKTTLASSTYNAHKLRGSKPEVFNRWVLALLGYEDGDTLDELFPGTALMTQGLNQTRLNLTEATP